MKTENPATRTLRVIDTILKTPHDTPGRTAWANALGADKKNDALLHIKLGTFMSSPAEAVRIMNESFPGLNAQTSEWYIKFTEAMSTTDFNNIIGFFHSKYTVQHNKFLLVMSHMIETSSYKEANQEEVTKAKAILLDLLEDIIASNLESKVKNYIIKSLRKIITSLEDYQLNGCVPVIESIELMMGRSFTDSDFRDTLKTPIGAKIFSVLGDVANIMTVSSGMPEIPWAQIGQSVMAKLTN